MPRPLHLLLALLAAALLAAACARQEGWQLKSVTGVVPDLAFNLTNERGKPVTQADFAGRPVLLFFGYTNCPDVCPTTLARLAQALKSLPERGAGVRVLFVTVDPARDTPARLQEYVGAFGPEFVGLRADPQELRELAKRYRITYSLGKPDAGGNYEVSHSSGVFVFDGAGRARLLILPSDSVPEITADLARLGAAS